MSEKNRSGSEQKREPFIRITRRKELPLYAAVLIRLAAIVIAFLVCALVTMLMTGLDPLGVFGAMIKGSFGTGRKAWVMLRDLAILLCVSLALTPAFRMKFWNLGGEGQILVGALSTAACMLLIGEKLSPPVLIIVMTLAAVVSGAVWAAIPAIFKARWNTNETLFTLMMNYVATQLVAFFVIRWENPEGSGKIGVINQDTEAGWFPMIAGNRYLLNIVIVAVLTVIMYIYMRYSKHGYELAVVGESRNTARYVGIKVERVIIRTMILSGAICGLAGLLLVAGTNHTVTTTIAGGRGFTAVMVAWLAQFNPITMIFSSFLLVFLSRGAGEISTAFRLNQSFGDILTGIILFFIIGCEFFVRYKVHFRKKTKDGNNESVKGGSNV
jgi:ABC-type uncharacterized transport system permease subunit